MIYFCSQRNRRELVLGKAGLNGIDYLEVLGPPGSGTQLAVTFLNDARSLSLGIDNISLSGGATVNPKIVQPATPEEPYVVTVSLDATGDFARYTLALVAGPGLTYPPPGLDPVLSTIEFSFKAGCPSPADCLASDCCAPTLAAPPDVNYLAKDYSGFVQVMIDRLAVLTPGWTETHAADPGVALVEALAYAADHLSYQQDAVSTEAYINTARSRISLRRHARLVDYTIDEGCNARTLVCVTTNQDGLAIPSGTLFYAGFPGLPVSALDGDPVAVQLATGTQPVFAGMQPATAYIAHNELEFYTWGDGDCCLPQGATAATLSGHLPDLQVGEMLIFEEVLGPGTGQPEDADPTHRWAVQLTDVQPADHLGQPLTDPVFDQQITEISWAAADALPFPLCISATITSHSDPVLLPAVTVARGNLIPVDHGVWIDGLESLGPVPSASSVPNPNTSCSCGSTSSAAASLPRFYPGLAQSPLTFCVPDAATGSANAFLSPNSSQAQAQIKLTDSDGKPWTPVPDLLSSTPPDRNYVLEIEADGSVFLRFGDNQHGLAPATGMSFTASYRVGNGSAGNIGRDALCHAVLPAGFGSSLGHVVAVRSPLPAVGGVDSESMQHIRQFAPFAFQNQERCVTEADYGQAAAAVAGVSEARGTLRWTGSWYTAFASVQPVSAPLTQVLSDAVTTQLNLSRMMGVDLAVEPATIVGLAITLGICVDPQHLRAAVYDALMAMFITGTACDGTIGLLNPSNFSFGQTVYASPLIAAAQAVDGVASATLTRFGRMDAPWVDGVSQGYLTMGRLDIPRCDNDPDHLDHGVFNLTLDGGR